MRLPFHLEHGPAIGWVLIVLVTGLVMLAVRRFGRRRTLELAASRWPADVPEGLDGADEGETRQLFGVLEAADTVDAFGRREKDRAACSSVDFGAGRLNATRVARGLALRTGERLVPIEGEVRCALGSTERRPGTHLEHFDRATERAIREAIDGPAPLSPPRFSSLRPGDRVRVIGALERRPEADADGYREAGSGWVVRPSDDGVVWLMFAGRPRVHAPSLGRQLGAGLFAAALTAGALTGSAAYALRDRPVPERRETLPFQEAWVWMSTFSPFHAEEVKRRLRGELHGYAPIDEAGAEASVEITRRGWGCSEAVREALAHGLETRALALATDCRPEARRDAFCAMGRYEQGADLGAELPASMDVVVALLGGRLERASAVAREAGATETIRDDARHWSCIADALDVRLGRAAARAPLTASAERSPFCRLLLADVSTGPERLRQLHGLELFDASVITLVLLAEVSPTAAAERLPHFADRISFHRPRLDGSLRVPIGGLREAFERLSSTPMRDAPQRLLRTVIGLFWVEQLATLGSLDEARDTLEVVREALASLSLGRLLEDAPPADEASLARLEPLIERARTAAEAWQNALRDSANDAAAPPFPSQELAGASSSVVAAARAGNGRRIAAAMGRGYFIHRQLRVLVRAASHERGTLATHLRYRRRAVSSCDVMRTLRGAAEERGYARVLGDAEWEHDRAAVLRSQMTAVRRRDVAVIVEALLNIRYVYSDPER